MSINLLTTGATNRTIAKALGITRRAVSKAKRKWSLATDPRISEMVEASDPDPGISVPFVVDEASDAAKNCVDNAIHWQEFNEISTARDAWLFASEKHRLALELAEQVVEHLLEADYFEKHKVKRSVTKDQGPLPFDPGCDAGDPILDRDSLSAWYDDLAFKAYHEMLAAASAANALGVCSINNPRLKNVHTLSARCQTRRRMRDARDREMRNATGTGTGTGTGDQGPLSLPEVPETVQV